MASTTKRSLTPAVKKARKTLSNKGYTYEAAAVALGVHRVHLTGVLCCQRESKSLLSRIQELPPFDENEEVQAKLTAAKEAYRKALES